MPRIQIMTEYGKRYMNNLAEYIVRGATDSKRQIWCGAWNYCLLGEEHMATGFVKQAHGYQDRYMQNLPKEIFHLQISFADSELVHLGIYDMMSIAYWLSANFFSNCMVLFGVHVDTERLHIHMCIHRMELDTAKGFSFGVSQWFALEHALCRRLENYISAESVEFHEPIYGQTDRAC